MFKSIIGATCACLAVVSLNVGAASLYGSYLEEYFEINPLRGEGTVLSFNPDFYNVALAFSPDGILYGYQQTVNLELTNYMNAWGTIR